MKRILERDLYCYVFYPDDLPQDKKDYINLNKNLFNDELAMLNEIKSQSDIPVPQSILDRINEKIQYYTADNEIVLTKLKIKQDLEYLTLAADSQTIDSKPTTNTFIDHSSNFLGKVITSGESNKVYLFSKDNGNIKELKITLIPSEEIIYSTSKDMPVIISPKQVIDAIKVEVVN